MNRGNPSNHLVTGAALLALTLGLATLAPAQITQGFPASPGATLASAGLVSIEFSVGSSGTGVGLPGSGVNIELFTEGGALPGGGLPETFDDIYAQFYSPPGAFGFTNVKLYDDGGPVVGAPGIFLPEPPASLTQRTPADAADIDSYAFLSPLTPVTASPASTALTGLFVQFSVDTVAAGFSTSARDVALESFFSEASGDVFEAFGPGGPGTALVPGALGGNELISDEGAHGLTSLPASPDDLDALAVNDSSLATGIIIDTDDTDTFGIPDMPLVYFTFNPAALGGLPATVATGADLCIPGGAPFSPAPTIPAPDPFVDVPAANLGLVAPPASPPFDNIDALFIDATGTNVIFSLDPFSPSLGTIPNPFTGVPGAAPGDLIHVVLGAPLPHLGVPVPPPAPPFVCLEGVTFGLVPGDNLNAVWVTAVPAGGAPLVPVELSVFSSD